MTEEKKRQYANEIRLCATVLKQIVEEISKDKNESFGLIITSNRYERVVVREPEEWASYLNISFYDKDGHAGPDYQADNVGEALYELL